MVGGRMLAVVVDEGERETFLSRQNQQDLILGELKRRVDFAHEKVS